MKTRLKILLILTASVLSLMSIMIVLSPYKPGQPGKVSNNDGMMPPIANFTYTPVYPIRGAIIQFWDNTTLGSGVLQYWRWTFGDNSSSIEHHPKHQYINTGVYTVQLNVTDINGKTSIKAKNIIISGNNPPDKPTITGSSSGKVGNEYSYRFKAIDPDKNQIYYCIDWGDNTSELTLGPYNSGYGTSGKHSWVTKGNYTIKVQTRDANNAESGYASFTVSISKNIFVLKLTPPFFLLFNIDLQKNISHKTVLMLLF
jgi:PKD repeat protein